MLEKMIRSQTAKQEQQLESFLARHDAANPFPEDVLLTADADYMGDGRPCHRMDIFRPREAKEALPVLVNIHGGDAQKRRHGACRRRAAAFLGHRGAEPHLRHVLWRLLLKQFPC